MDIINLIRREIEAYVEARNVKKYGVVTSWDPDKCLAKVKIMPEGQETGWLPVRTAHIGAGWGMMVGLTDGDQVSLEPHQGDLDSLEITGVVHSEQDKPPGPVQSGEMVFKHKTGTFMKMSSNGKVEMTDAAGATVSHDGSGNTTLHAPQGMAMSSGSGTTITSDMSITGTVTIN